MKIDTEKKNNVKIALSRVCENYNKTYESREEFILIKNLYGVSVRRLLMAADHLIEIAENTFKLPNKNQWLSAISATTETMSQNPCQICGRSAVNWHYYAQYTHICLGCKTGIEEKTSVADLVPANEKYSHDLITEIIKQFEEKQKDIIIGKLTKEEENEILLNFGSQVDRGMALTTDRGYEPHDTARFRNVAHVPLVYDGDPRDITSAGIDTTHAAYYRARDC